MENPDKNIWGDATEIAAMSEMLGVNVSVYQEQEEVLTPVPGAEHNINSDTEICLLYTKAEIDAGVNNPNNHYNYLLKKEDLPTNKIKLQENTATAAVRQAEIQENANEFKTPLEHQNITSGHKGIKIEEIDITKEPYCIEPGVQSQANISTEEMKSGDGSSLFNSSNKDIIASAFTRVNFSDSAQIAENVMNSANSDDSYVGSATNINQTDMPHLNNSNICYSFSSCCNNLMQTARKAKTLVTKPLVYAYKNSNKIRQSFYQLANATSKEGIINGLQRSARARCSLDGSTRL